MNTNRINAAIVGILFILGTVTGVVAATIENPILSAPNYLVKMAVNSEQMTIGTFLQFLMAMSCAGIGLALYPIMRKYSEGLAIAVSGFRVIEGMIQVLGGVLAISLLSLSQAFVKAGAPDPLAFQTTGAVIKAGSDWINNGAMLLPWCIAALMYYSVFYQHHLVPRWISIWGLVGILLTILSSLFQMLNLLPATATFQTVANLPIAVQEMVFAVWLIVKGISSSPIASLPERTPTL